MKARVGRQLVALFAASARELVRDRLAMFFAFVFPLVFVVSLAIEGASARRPQLDVIDRAQSAASRELVSRLGALADVRVVTPAMPPRDVVVDIPAAFGDGDGDATITLRAPATLTAPIGSMLDGIAGAMSLAARGQQAAFAVRRQDTGVGAVAFALPGLLALALLQLGLVATASPLVTARQRGTLRHLWLAPVSRVAAVVAHVSVRLLMALLQVALMALVATRLFALHPTAPAALQIGLVALEAAMLVSLGYLAGALLPASDVSYGILTLLNVALIFLGGLFNDVHAGGVYRCQLASPLFYAVDANRQLFARLPGVLSLKADVVAMGGWMVGCVLAAAAAVTSQRSTR